MRIYLPSTSTALRELASGGLLDAVPFTGFAVTPGLREWYLDDDVEALEYAAMTEAARASLRLIDGDPAAARRRVVIALDAPDPKVEIRDDLERGVVRVNATIGLAQVAAVHVDEAEAEAAVARAAASIIAADLGSEPDQEAVDDAEGHELSWYASQEIADVLAAM